MWWCDEDVQDAIVNINDIKPDRTGLDFAFTYPTKLDLLTSVIWDLKKLLRALKVNFKIGHLPIQVWLFRENIYNVNCLNFVIVVVIKSCHLVIGRPWGQELLSF